MFFVEEVKKIFLKNSFNKFIIQKYGKGTKIKFSNFGFIIIPRNSEFVYKYYIGKDFYKNKDYNSLISCESFYFQEQKNYDIFINKGIFIPLYEFIFIDVIDNFSFYVSRLENVRRFKNKFYNFNKIPPSKLAFLIKEIHFLYKKDGKSFIHGNIHPRNFFYDKKNKLGIFDLVNCRIGEKEQDIARIYIYSSFNENYLEKFLFFYKENNIDKVKIYKYVVKDMYDNLKNVNISNKKKIVIKLKIKELLEKISFLSLLKKLQVNENELKDSGRIEIVLRITQLCNEKCLFCNVDMNNEEIKFEDICKIINYFRNKYFKKDIYFTLSGGEPTLHKDFLKIIDFIISKNAYVIIQTNAISFSNEYFLKKILERKGLYFTISFHSHIEDLYNKITGSNFFKKAFFGIKNIYSLYDSDKINLNFVVNKFNKGTIKEYFIFLNEKFSQYNKINISISTLNGLNKNQEYLFVKYIEIINAVNEAHEFIGNIVIDINAGGYCNVPFCIFNKLKFINKKNLLDYAVGIDYEKGKDIIYKSEKCINCKFNIFCSGLPKRYYLLYGDKEINTIKL